MIENGFECVCESAYDCILCAAASTVAAVATVAHAHRQIFNFQTICRSVYLTVTQ